MASLSNGANGGHAKEEGDAAVEAISTTLQTMERPRGKQRALWNSSRRSIRSQPREASAGPSSLLSSHGLKEIVKALTDMVTTVEPVTTTFDKVLGEDATRNFNATLNTVPVVGLKGDKIMYLQRRLNAAGTATEDSWTVFSGLPVVPDSKNVFLFPFAGALCVAIGQKVWRKAHDRPDADEASRARALDDWPELYVDHWDKVGDAMLPPGELRGVVTCSTLCAEKKVVEFHLVVLKADGSLHALDGLKPSSIKPLAFTGSAPKLVRIACWDGQIVGIDVDNNVVSLRVSFAEKTCTVVETTPDSPVTEFTADEEGPIVVREDGFLYKRVGSKWSKWVAQDDVTHLAVASPGVFLSLNTLTRALKTRYVAAQTALHPVVSKLGAFCATHEVFLESMQKAAGDGAKQAMAVKQGRAFVDHAKSWSMILHLSMDGSKEIVRTMTEQLSDVHDQLKVQLRALLEKIKGLQPLLRDPEATVDRACAASYGALGAKFLGVAMAVTDAEAPGLTLSGGALAIGALVAAILEGKKVSELSEKMHADTEAQLVGVTKAVSAIRVVVDSYDVLHAKFDALNSFWRGASADANSLGAMDDAAVEKLGRQFFEDKVAVAAAMHVTSELGAVCKTYLDALHAQGVTPKAVQHGVSAHMLFHKGQHGGAHQKHAHHGQSAAHRQNSATKSSSMQKDLHDAFHRHVHEAQGKLKAHDLQGYAAAINQARFVSFAIIASAVDAQVVSGHWFDVPALLWNASVWNGYRAPIHVGLMDGDEISNAQRRLIGALTETKPLVVLLLQETAHLAKTFRRWKGKFPQPTGHASPELDKLKHEAMAQCKAGEELAARAYSRFSVFESQAMKWQQDRESEIVACREDSPRLSQLRELQQSGNAFYRNAYTWIRMCAQVGEILGGHIHNILVALAHSEDPTLYSALMSTDWTKIGNDAATVLDILAAHTTPRSVSTAAKANKAALVRALCPDAALADLLRSQAKSATAVFDAVNAVAKLPSSGLVAFWDDARESRTTMLDVAHHIRDQYVQLVATEYDVVEKLYTLSILQAIRASNYAEQGRIPLDALIKVSFQSFSTAYHVANRAAIEFSNSATQFDSAISQMNANLASVHVDESMLPDAIAATVSSPIAFAASPVASSVTHTLIQSTSMGLGAAATAENLNLAVHELRPYEKIQLVHALQAVKEHCDATSKQLAKLQPHFHQLVDGLKGVATSLMESSNGLHELLQRAMCLGALGTITTEDATRIESEWKKMAGGARVWMDAIDAQNISHVTFSVQL